MKHGEIVWINPNELVENKIASKLYSTPENYDMMKENIRQVGILEPIIVIDNVVESGNLRLRIAKELGFETVPVIFQPKSDVNANLRVVSHGQQRVKKYSEILAEYKILEAEYPVGKGCRTDLDPAKKCNMEKKKALNISKAKLTMLKNIEKLGEELHGTDSTEYQKIWKEVDSEKTSLNRIVKGLKREKAIRENKFSIPNRVELNAENAKIYNKSCENMSEIEDKSIACIITSPPYFQMRDYGTGEAQRGLEKDVDTFIEGLISDFNDCKRVLKDDGSLWVNLGEAVLSGHYNAIPHKFVIEMMKNGWIFNDEIIWVKNNPIFTQAKRTIRSHEYIFHFVKSENYHYDLTWMSELNDPSNQISLGTSGKISNLMSAMDFRGNIVRTGGNNMSDLRKSCKKQGFNLTHNAAFPITIPLISVLTTSKIGDTVLDIYSGTATTGEAALATNRKYVGYELKPEYIMGSVVRLQDYTQDSVLEVA